jgi:hypothetical protein
VGSIFVLYTPLQPSIYSLGGIALALGMLLIAKFYEKIMNIKYFFYITLFVELTVFVFVISFLILNYSYKTALIVYIGYQITFVFGSYLVRMETIALKKTILLSFADVAKQKGYLAGLVASYLFYKILEYFGIIDKQIEVYDLYIIAFLLQAVILFLVIKSFVFKKRIGYAK